MIDRLTTTIYRRIRTRYVKKARQIVSEILEQK